MERFNEKERLGHFYELGYREIDSFGTIGRVLNGNVTDLRYPHFDCRGRLTYRPCKWVNGEVVFVD